MKPVSEFTEQELQFLGKNNIIHVRFVDGVPVGILKLMFTHGLVTGYQPVSDGDAYNHRFCYPKTDFSLVDVIKFALEWNPSELPPDGWVKYKGVKGEFTPEEKHELVKLL